MYGGKEEVPAVQQQTHEESGRAVPLNRRVSSSPSIYNSISIHIENIFLRTNEEENEMKRERKSGTQSLFDGVHNSTNRDHLSELIADFDILKG